jgi:hypothetical protein
MYTQEKYKYTKLNPFVLSLKLDGVSREPCTRTDILFAKKNGGEIFANLFAGLEKKNNTISNMNSVYTTIGLFCVELFCEETLFDFVRLIMSFQELAITSAVLSPTQKIHLHVISLSLFTLIAHFLPVLKDYIASVSLFLLFVNSDENMFLSSENDTLVQIPHFNHVFFSIYVNGLFAGAGLVCIPMLFKSRNRLQRKKKGKCPCWFRPEFHVLSNGALVVTVRLILPAGKWIKLFTEPCFHFEHIGLNFQELQVHHSKDC